LVLFVFSLYVQLPRSKFNCSLISVFNWAGIFSFYINEE
jgi:hypothetical protein